MSLIVLQTSYEMSESLNKRISELTGTVLIDIPKTDYTQGLFDDYFDGKISEEEFSKELRHLHDLLLELFISKKVKPYLIGVDGSDRYGNNSKENNKERHKNIEEILKSTGAEEVTLLISSNSNYTKYAQKKLPVESIEFSTPFELLNNTQP